MLSSRAARDLHKHLNISNPLAIEHHKDGLVIFSRLHGLISDDVIWGALALIKHLALSTDVATHLLLASFEYEELLKARAMVFVPWSFQVTTWFEVYAMGVPLFVPAKRFAIGILSALYRVKPWRFAELLDEHAMFYSDCQPRWFEEPPKHFCVGLMPGRFLRRVICSLEDLMQWWDFTDFATNPHVQYFESFPQLFLRLQGEDLSEVSRQMLIEQVQKQQTQMEVLQSLWLQQSLLGKGS